MIVLRRSLFISVLMFLCHYTASATPELGLLSGNRCINCHVSGAGGGLRSDLGWYSMNETSIVDPDDIGFTFVQDISSGDNLLTDDILYGFDIRVQSTRSHETEDAERKTFPMQASLYAGWTATDWLTVDGVYNGGPKKYDGQQSYKVRATVQPSFRWPALTLGYFSPDIGLRFDDHTILSKQIPSSEFLPLFAPYYAEAGAEVRYDGLKWLSVSGGVFDNSSLTESSVFDSAFTSNNSVLMSGKVLFWTRPLDNTTMSVSGSVLTSGDYVVYSGFFGAGYDDIVSIWLEYTTSDLPDVRETEALSAQVMFNALEGVLPYVRYSQGEQTQFFDEELLVHEADEVVVGAQLFVLPFLELRPEYRIRGADLTPRTIDQYSSSRWHVQLHLFY